MEHQLLLAPPTRRERGHALSELWKTRTPSAETIWSDTFTSQGELFIETDSTQDSLLCLSKLLREINQFISKQKSDHRSLKPCVVPSHTAVWTSPKPRAHSCKSPDQLPPLLTTSFWRGKSLTLAAVLKKAGSSAEVRFWSLSCPLLLYSLFLNQTEELRPEGTQKNSRGQLY